MKATYQIDIDAPMDKVFEFLHDPEKHKLWLKGVEETTYLPGYDPQNAVGAKFKQKIREGGRVKEYDGEVTACARPKHLGVRLFCKEFSVQVDYRLSPLEKGTRLDFEANITFGNWFFRVMAALFGWLMRRTLRKQMNKLKAVAEGVR